MIEITRDNISIDPCLDVDNNWNPPCIVAYIELLFEADEKFGTHTRNRDDAWINLYAMYSPVYKTVQLEYYIETDTSVSGPHSYAPTASECRIIMEMIEEKCREAKGYSCVELLLMEG